MPKIKKVFELDVSPQKYVNACDKHELNELIMLASEELNRRDRAETVGNYKRNTQEQEEVTPRNFLNHINH